MGSEQEYGGAVSYYLDIQSLASLVRSKRGARGLRAIAQECRTSASTISRVEREQVPDISSFYGSVIGLRSRLQGSSKIQRWKNNREKRVVAE